MDNFTGLEDFTAVASIMAPKLFTRLGQTALRAICNIILFNTGGFYVPPATISPFIYTVTSSEPVMHG